MANPENSMNISQMVLESSKKVVDEAAYVRISKAGVEKYVTMHEAKKKHWLQTFSWIDGMADVDTLMDIIFSFNTISFCYWGNPKWTSNVGGKLMDGSKLLLMCLRERVHQDCNFLKPVRLMQLGYEEYIDMLKGGFNLKFLEERYRLLKELGSMVYNGYAGSYLRMIEHAEGTVQDLLGLIVSNMPWLKDEALYKEHTVFFYKRAQLLVSDIGYCLSKGGFDKLNGIDSLTACADYKIPQILNKLGILEYASALNDKIKACEEIERGSQEEIEIRSSTIMAIEMIRSRYRKQGRRVSSMNVNDDLWIMSQSLSQKDWPYHQTQTTSY